jgi:recombination protein RecT
MASNLPTKRTDMLEKLLVARFEEIKAVIPQHLTPERLARIDLTVYRQNPKLAQCTIESAVGAMLQACQLGLELGSAQGLAFLVPYFGKTEKVVQLQIGYKGLIELAMRSGYFSFVQARVVYENDEFSFEHGTGEYMKHRPTLGRRGNPVAVYGVAVLKDGQRCFEVLSMADIERVKTMSKTPRGGPWDTHYEAMARKTALRRLLKPLPSSTEMRTAVGLDERAEAGAPQHFEPADFTIEGPPELPAAATKGETLKGADEPAPPGKGDDSAPALFEPDDWDAVADGDLLDTIGRLKLTKAQKQKLDSVVTKGSWEDLRQFAREVSG